jgi:AcrR family transcriptional regulator
METQQRIQSRARELFLKYGIRSISMDDIATQLGVSKKTIYQYFTDKDGLVDAIIEEEINHMQQECLDCIQRSKNAIDEIFLTLRLAIEQFRNMNPAILHDLQKFHPLSYGHIEKHKRQFLSKVIAANIERGIREDLYRREVSVDIMSKFHLESMMLLFDQEAFPAQQYKLADLNREVTEHYIYGLATPKGIALIESYKREMI